MVNLKQQGTLENLLHDVDAEFYEPTIGHVLWKQINYAGPRFLLSKSTGLPIAVTTQILFSQLWKKVS